MNKSEKSRREEKARHCRCCGEAMSPVRLWICENCQALGRTVVPPHKINAEELETVARARQACGMNPLEGMSMEEIAALAWTYRREGCGSYGKLRGYVRMTGRLPDRRA